MDSNFGNLVVVIFADRPLNICDCLRIYWKRRLKCNNKKQGVEEAVNEDLFREEEDVVVVEEDEEEEDLEVVGVVEEEVVVANRVVDGD